ncbi:MAG: class I SAM-dependent methyltransferase [Spirochaetes bacterium]|nr:class I SAM-dependent methyltransferase [Spirochaetota bacterium]
MDSTKRFSDRVDDYRKYRPGYPFEIINLLNEKCGLTKNSTVADVGSGTGILTGLLLPHAGLVYAVEPNDAMRKAAEDDLSRYASFRSINGTAELTTLPDCTVDLICAAQAFHWFDRGRAKIEFLRIAKKGAWTVLIWNDRSTENNDFQAAYETFLKEHIPGYGNVTHKNIDDTIVSDFYAPEPFEKYLMKHAQQFEFDSLLGRLRSSSYAPKEYHEHYDVVVQELRRIFDAYNVNGRVVFEYCTNVFIGKTA